MPTYLITGASRGIGAELVRQLAARNDTVLAGVRRPGALPRHPNIRELQLDVADPASVAALPAALANQPIDVLINNAGVTSDVKSVADLTYEELERVFRINAVAPMIVTRALLPNLRAGRARKIINISSIMGSLTDAASKPDAKSYAYRASKSCLNMLTICLANELRKDGFACAALHPGWVQTDMGGQGAHLSPEESVRGLLRVIDSLTVAHTGAYLDHTGRRMDW
ncbi:MAG TPA: SDR family oxidoreductase [Phycisphaerales bacterium]|nr:SDR family oxidoreductase [Phycisphaerales bacterium]